MAPQLDTELLVKSCMKAFEYPGNLARPGVAQHHLKAYHARLNKHSSRLFSTEDDHALTFWDYDDDATEFRPTVASYIVQLRARIEGSHLFSHADPKCRFIFIHATGSHTHLKIDREMLTTILSRYQVMPSFLDFIFPFGQHEDFQDFDFSGFRVEPRLSPPTRGLEIPVLGRSGREIQMCYNLKSAESRDDSERPWSVRQTAVYHSFDIEAGSSSWIIVKGNQLVQNRIHATTSKGVNGLSEIKYFMSPSSAFSFTLATHLTIANLCNEEWRWYLSSLENQSQDATQSIRMSIDKEPNLKTADSLDAWVYGLPKQDEGSMYKSVGFVQSLEEKVNATILFLQTNSDILSELKDFYRSILQSGDFPEDLRSGCQGELLCSILDFKSVESNKIFCQEAQASTLRIEEMTESMHQIAMKTQQETVSMKIITLVTLFFLPGTFISTLMSTDIVTFQNGSQSFSLGALKLYLAITLPCMAFTFAAWYGIYLWARRKERSAKVVSGGDVPLV